jgi:hypothetical protein
MWQWSSGFEGKIYNICRKPCFSQHKQQEFNEPCHEIYIVWKDILIGDRVRGHEIQGCFLQKPGKKKTETLSIVGKYCEFSLHPILKWYHQTLWKTNPKHESLKPSKYWYNHVSSQRSWRTLCTGKPLVSQTLESEVGEHGRSLCYKGAEIVRAKTLTLDLILRELPPWMIILLAATIATSNYRSYGISFLSFKWAIPQMQVLQGS